MIMGNLSGLVNGTEAIVFDYEVTGSAVSSISTGNILNGDEDGWYTIICRVINTSTNDNYGIRFNGDAGNTYGYRGIFAQSTSVSDTVPGAGYTSRMHLGSCGGSASTSLTVARMFAKSGSVRLMNSTISEYINGTSIDIIVCKAQVWNNTVDNITSASLITGSGSNLLFPGTRIIILKSNNFTNGTPCGTITTPYIKGSWVRVGSQVLASSASSVTFSGLDGDRDVVYAISCSIKGASASASQIQMLFNSDSGGNYGFQKLSGYSTTVNAQRNTGNSQIRINEASVDVAQNNYLSAFCILFAKQGFVRPMISMSSDNISGTTVGATTIKGHVYSVTNTSIATITINASQASGLASGSTFDLYALRPNG